MARGNVHGAPLSEPHPMARPRSILHNYFVVVTSPHWIGPREFRAFVKDPPSALIYIHKVLQRTKEVGAKREVIRPKLKPDEYEVIRLFLRYEDNDKRDIQANIDMPRSPNPDATKKPKIKTENLSFGFPEEEMVKLTEKPPEWCPDDGGDEEDVEEDPD
jgi:hypothetical protein